MFANLRPIVRAPVGSICGIGNPSRRRGSGRLRRRTLSRASGEGTSLYPIPRPFVRNVGALRLGGRHVGGGAGGVAGLAPHDTAPEQRVGEPWGQRQGLVVVGERAVEPAELELDQRTAPERLGLLGLETERLVAVVEPGLEIADDRPRPAA